MLRFLPCIYVMTMVFISSVKYDTMVLSGVFICKLLTCGSNNLGYELKIKCTPHLKLANFSKKDIAFARVQICVFFDHRRIRGCQKGVHLRLFRNRL